MITLASASVAVFFPDTWRMTPNGTPVLTVVAMLAGVWCLASLCTIITVIMFQRKGRPVSEGLMIGRLYRLLSIIGMILVIAYGFGKLGTFGTLFSMFGGMLLGWSLQAPVSGFAAWLLVSIKRPFRPGDRVQFPNLGLNGRRVGDRPDVRGSRSGGRRRGERRGGRA